MFARNEFDPTSCGFAPTAVVVPSPLEFDGSFSSGKITTTLVRDDPAKVTPRNSLYCTRSTVHVVGLFYLHSNPTVPPTPLNIFRRSMLQQQPPHHRPVLPHLLEPSPPRDGGAREVGRGVRPLGNVGNDDSGVLHDTDNKIESNDRPEPTFHRHAHETVVGGQPRAVPAKHFASRPFLKKARLFVVQRIFGSNSSQKGQRPTLRKPSKCRLQEGDGEFCLGRVHSKVSHLRGARERAKDWSRHSDSVWDAFVLVPLEDVKCAHFPGWSGNRG